MLSSKLSLTLAFTAIFFFVEAASSSEPVKIGPFYQCAHDLKGVVYALNEKQLLILGFDYDGPGAWFHGQLKGSKAVHTSDPATFVTLPYPKESCDKLQVGKRYTNENVTLTLPRSIKEFETIGIFCYQYCHNFGHIYIPKDLALPPAPADLPEVKDCPKPEFKGCTVENTRNSAIHPNCPAGDTKGRTAEDNAATVQSLDKMLIGLCLCYFLSFLF